jgi:hypothetical protein
MGAFDIRQMEQTYAEWTLYKMEKRYQFRLKGHLDKSWKEWLSDMSIEQQPDGTTLITGQIADQAALFGLLSQLRDLGMPLLSINTMSSDQLTLQEAITVEK